MELKVLYTLLQRSGHGLSFKRAFALLAAALCCCTPIFAQTNIEKKQDSIRVQSLKDVEVRGAKANMRSASPTPVQVLHGNELQRLNSLSVADALRYYSGVQLKDYGGIGGLKTVNVRSLGSNHTGVFYDGIAIGNAQNGQTDLGKFSLDNLDALELYNGQKSTLLQPARSWAFGSTLYLQSKLPQFARGETTNAKVSVRSGSFGLFNPALLWQQKLSGKLSSSVSAEWVKSNGLYRFRETNGTYDTSAIRMNADINAYRIETGLNGVLTDSSTYTVKAYLYHSSRGLPGAVVKGRFENFDRQWDNNFFIQSSYSKTVGTVYNLLLNAKYANDYTHYLKPSLPTDLRFVDNKFMQQEAYFSAANLFHINSYLDVSLSADLQFNTLKKLDADQYRFVYPERYTALTALSAQYHLSKLQLQATLLGTWVNEKVKLYNGADNRNIYTPSVSAVWQPWLAHEFRFRTFYKEIFRMPTFNDLYYTLVGNASLKPEYTTQFDVGFTYNKLFAQSLLQHLSIETDVYYNRVRDKIVAIPTTNLFRWTMLNLGLVNIRGLDINLRTNWAGWANTNFHAGISYTYQRALDSTPPPNASAFQGQIPYVPKHSGSAIFGADYGALQLNYSFLYTGERYTQKDNIPANYAQPWYTHDVSASWSPLCNGNLVKLTAEVNNLLNQNYDVVINYPMPGRSYRLGLSLNY
jgi:vitamin B12 transporter